MKKVLLCLTILFSSLTLAVDFYSLSEKRNVSIRNLMQTIDSDALILMGETHYLVDSIKTQAFIIKTLAEGIENDGVTVAWEFLNYSDQVKISTLYQNYKRDQFPLNTLLEELFPVNENGTNPNHLYSDLFATSKEVGANFLGTNAPRPWKRVVVSEGVEALPAIQVPRSMRRGSDEYFDRFLVAVGGHGDPSALEGYFMAQSYTDAFMAQSLVDDTADQLTFMTVGYFHNDYGHGLPSYLLDMTGRQVVNFRLISKSETSSEELELLKSDELYGNVADYIVLY